MHRSQRRAHGCAHPAAPAQTGSTRARKSLIGTRLISCRGKANPLQIAAQARMQSRRENYE